MGVMGFFLVLFLKLSPISEEFSRVHFSIAFFHFFSDGLLRARDVALTSSSRTFALFPALSRSAMQLIENPLILCLRPIRLKLLFK